MNIKHLKPGDWVEVQFDPHRNVWVKTMVIGVGTCDNPAPDTRCVTFAREDGVGWVPKNTSEELIVQRGIPLKYHSYTAWTLVESTTNIMDELREIPTFPYRR